MRRLFAFGKAFKNQTANGLALKRTAADIAGQIAAVFDRESNQVVTRTRWMNRTVCLAQTLHAEFDQFKPWQNRCQLLEPARESGDFCLAQRRWRIAPKIHPIPAADFHRTKLRVLVGLPAHMGLTATDFITPLQEL
ncbi:MAG: hypothetical protein EBW47_11320 [Betaproteobacteria bacterium]|nr:hypothetical protein [Betaproteobacteria bacterium]